MRGVMGEEVIFLGPDGLINTTFVEGAGDAAEGAYLTFAGYTPDELRQGGPGADYVTRVTERLGDTLRTAYAVYAYETAVVVIQALDRVGEKDRTKILDDHVRDRRLRQPARRHLELHRVGRHRFRDHRP